MRVFNTIKQSFIKKAFPVELPENNIYPYTKGFEHPTEGVLIASILKYAESTHETVEILSVGKPIVFRLNDKDTYEATLKLGRSRMRPGYYLHCRQILD